jgi:hypothetical protein
MQKYPAPSGDSIKTLCFFVILDMVSSMHVSLRSRKHVKIPGTLRGLYKNPLFFRYFRASWGLSWNSESPGPPDGPLPSQGQKVAISYVDFSLREPLFWDLTFPGFTTKIAILTSKAIKPPRDHRFFTNKTPFLVCLKCQKHVKTRGTFGGGL